jgi:tRNA pseudouridine55 synthase
MQGALLVDKPNGWTSFDVVNYVRRIIASSEGKKSKQVKVGHTGTLDPFATGLLILLIGKEYTRRAGELSKADKTYDVTMRLGETSTTGDPEGHITEQPTKEQPSLERLTAALNSFVGQIEQVPPSFSAIKVDGQRAYKLAREGKAIVLAARPVTIYEIKQISYEFPIVRFTTRVSSGTYIRTLVEDIGRLLECGAYTNELRRTAIRDFTVANSLAVETLTAELIYDHFQVLSIS